MTLLIRCIITTGSLQHDCNNMSSGMMTSKADSNNDQTVQVLVDILIGMYVTVVAGLLIA